MRSGERQGTPCCVRYPAPSTASSTTTSSSPTSTSSGRLQETQSCSSNSWMGTMNTTSITNASRPGLISLSTAQSCVTRSKRTRSKTRSPPSTGNRLQSREGGASPYAQPMGSGNRPETGSPLTTSSHTKPNTGKTARLITTMYSTFHFAFSTTTPLFASA